MRTCKITFTPDNKERQADIQTGGVTTLELLDFFKTLSTGFATQLVDEYKEATGDYNVDEKAFQEWVTFLRNNQL